MILLVFKDGCAREVEETEFRMRRGWQRWAEGGEGERLVGGGAGALNQVGACYLPHVPVSLIPASRAEVWRRCGSAVIKLNRISGRRNQFLLHTQRRQIKEG